MARLRKINFLIAFSMLSVIFLAPPAKAVTAAEATTLLNNCISTINDPLYTRATLPGIMGYANVAAIESDIVSGRLGVYIANGAGVIPNSANANGGAPDIFCGDSNDNQVATMDSDTISQDYFFGGAGNDSLTATMWFSSFYGGPGNDYANSIQERSTFTGGPGNDTYTTLSADSTFTQGVDDNTAPTFPSSETFSTPENTTLVGTITTSESATITIFGGADQTKFDITRLTDSSTSLSFKTAPNFEVPTDDGLNNTYVVVFRAVDGASNAGYETVTVTVTDVVESSSFSAFTIAANPIYRTTVQLSATVSVAAKVIFRVNGVRIPGCVSKPTATVAPFTVNCSWKPARRGPLTLSATATPTAGGISSSSATPIRVFVANRSSTR